MTLSMERKGENSHSNTVMPITSESQMTGISFVIHLLARAHLSYITGLV